MKLNIVIISLLLLILITNCINESSEKCREDAKRIFIDSCVNMLILAPVLDPQEPSFDQV